MKIVLTLLVLLLAANALKNNLHTATATATTTTTTAAGTPKLCGYNSLGVVPGDNSYTFQVKTVKNGGYAQGDFEIVGWKKTKASSFFKSLGKTANFHGTFVSLTCQIGKKEDLETICGKTKANVDKSYSNHFGFDIIFKCQVPKDSIVLGVSYNIKAGDVKYNQSSWAYFTGVYKFKDSEDVKKLVQSEGKKISDQAKTDKLNCLSLDNDLNYDTESTKKLLAQGFNSNSASAFVKGVKANTGYPVEGEGSLQVLPPGTRFIVGSIFKGTTAIKSICHNLKYQETDNCNVHIA